MHDVRALLFDLDGTLIASADANYSAYAKALAEVGVTIDPKTVEEVAAGRQWREFLPELLARAGVEHDASLIAARKGEMYREMIGELRVNWPLVELARSSRRTMRTALVTTASTVSVAALLHHFELEDVFDVVVAGGDVLRHKPDPEAYRVALTRLGVPAEQCLAFEDSEVGIASATAAGVPTVRIVFD